MAVPGPAAALLQSGWGSRCWPALQWRRNSPARQQRCLVQQHRGNPCRHGHCCCPAELRHQGAGLVPSQQSLPSNCSWWPLLWDFIPCLPVQSSKPPSGPEEGWHVPVCWMQGISCGHPTRPSLSGPSPCVQGTLSKMHPKWLLSHSDALWWQHGCFASSFALARSVYWKCPLVYQWHSCALNNLVFS